MKKYWGNDTSLSDPEPTITVKMTYEAINATEQSFPETTLKELIEQQYRETPDRIALTFKDQQLTYRELNERANQLARKLRDGGVKPDQVVGVLLERSLEMMVGIFAILKAGGAYLPLAPEAPQSRIHYMLSDAGATVLLTHKGFADKLEFAGAILALDDPGLYVGDAQDLPTLHASSDAAYVIYTSGSTGQPKGVIVEQRSVVNRLWWMQRAYPIGEADVLIQKTPIHFDVSVWELFWWAFTGSRLHILGPGMAAVPFVLADEIARRKVTVMHFVPSMLNVFLAYLEHAGTKDRLASLRTVFCSGEALKPLQVEQFYQQVGIGSATKLVNLYGPTEATVDVSWFNCLPGKTYSKIPIGKPIDNLRLYVVNENLEALPPGQEGELVIAGEGLARAYLNQPALTQAKFIQPQIEGEERVYRTGDLAVLNAEGEFEFLGRIDRQIKIRGMRIEPGEIESVTRRHPAVRDCLVLARQPSPNIILLIAFVVLKSVIDPEEIKVYCREYLPDYMIPGRCIALDSIPLTPNGKADRKALIALI